MIYTLRPAAKGLPAELRIYGDIGPDPWADESNDAKTVTAQLSGISGPLTVRINSYGGAVADGLAIYNALRRHQGAVTVTVDGVAFSIASLIAMAGSVISMADNALMMVHAPWGGAVGNAVELRNMADILDKYADAMAVAYTRIGGPAAETVRGWLTDGQDHYFSAAEAIDLGLIDQIDQPAQLPLAAALRDRYAIPAAYAALTTRRPATMADDITTPAVAPVPAVTQTPTEIVHAYTDATRQGQEAGARAEAKRQADIRKLYALRPFNVPQIVAVLDQCLTDIKCDRATAMDRALAAVEALPESQPINASAAPTAGGAPWAGTYAPPPSYGVATPGPDQMDKGREAQVQAIMARAGRAAHDPANPYRGLKLIDIARESLARAGIRTQGRDYYDVARMALGMGVFAGQTRSDFPVVIQDVLHQMLLSGYMAARVTWPGFCKTGTVTDFRDWKRMTPGLMGTLETVNEAGEYRDKAIPDAEQESIAAVRHGNIIAVTPETLVDDNLGYIDAQARDLGNVAARSVERAVWTLLNANPTMADTNALFSSAHANIAATGGAPTVAIADAMAVQMASQTAPGADDEYLDIIPAVFVGPRSLQGTATVLFGAEYDPDTANKLQKPNMVRGIVDRIVTSPRATALKWYLFADPDQAPVIEVVYLDGQAQPRIISEENFRSGGMSWRVEHHYGVGAIGWRGAVYNAGQ